MDYPSLPDDKYLRAIGAVALRWAYLEETINAAIHHLLKADDKAAHAVTDEINSTPTRLSLLKRLANLRGINASDQKRLNQKAEFIRQKLSVRRNETVHEMLRQTTLIGGVIKSGKSTRRRGRSFESVESPAEIQISADEIYQFTLGFREFLRKLGALPPPSLPIFPPPNLPAHSISTLLTDPKPKD